MIMTAKNHLHIIYGSFQHFLEKSVDWQIRQRGDYTDVDRIFSVYAFSREGGEGRLNDRHLVYNAPIARHPIRFFASYFNFLRMVHRLVRRENIAKIWVQCHIYFIPLFIFLRLFCRQCVVGVGLRGDLDLAYRLGGPCESETLFGSRKLAWILEGVIYRWLCDYVFPRSENLLLDLVARGIPEKKIVLQRFELPKEFNPADFPPAEDVKKKFDADGRIILFSFFGRMTRYNYVYDILDLFAKIRKRDNRAFLFMAGRGPEEEGLRRRLTELGLDSCVNFPGFVPRAEVLAIRKASDFSLCLMGGNSLLEAAAMGSVVAAYDVDWHTELITHMYNGIVVPEGRVDEMFEAILQVRDNPSLRDVFTERTWEIIRRKYTQKPLSVFSRAENQ